MKRRKFHLVPAASSTSGHRTGTPERTARRVFNDVIALGLLASETPKGPVSLRFPADALDALFPKLFPET
ncbi:hypothetical protein NKG99_14495 [Mesorhizobium sp. M1409]|uniref:hypothetical protein n=1 Tax=unclassified Mesorhizobium TaxID=325217 RepID=UPI00333A0CAD